MERIGGDLDFLQELAGLFFEDSPKLLEEIRAAVERADAQSLERAAHTLKGAVANFGGEAAREAAFRLEKMGRGRDLSDAREAYSALQFEMNRFGTELRALSARIDAER